MLIYLIFFLFGFNSICYGDEAVSIEAYSKGDKVNLTCPLEGEIKWIKNDKELKRDSKKFTFDGSVLYFVIDKELVGMFICKNEEKSENLTVYVKPFVDPETKKEKNSIQDEMLVVECKGFGYPKPEVTWTHKPLETTESSNTEETVLTEDDRVSFRSDDMVNNTLRIRGVKYEDAGTYLCNAINQFGNSSLVISVKVKDKFAALWPFLAICAEVAILCAIIFVYEKRRAKRMEEEEKREEAANLTAASEVKATEDVRHRK